MTTLAENSNNDIYLDGSRNLATVTGLAEVQQNCAAGMETVLGECVLDLQYGIPYDASMWQRYLPIQFEAAGRAMLKSVAGVTSVESFVITRTGDVANYSALIQTAFGPTSVAGVISNV